MRLSYPFIPVAMNSDQGLGAKTKAISGRVQKLLQGPNGLKLGFSGLSLVLLLMYSIIHIFNKDVLLIVSLFAELVRLFGVLIITVNLRQKSSGSKATNISLMSQKFYLVVFGTRLIFKLFYEDFDLIYVLVESSALAATAYIVYMLTTVANRDAPSTPDPEAKCTPPPFPPAPPPPTPPLPPRYYFLPLVCFLVALLLHPKVASNNFMFNTLWAFSTYLECLSLLPQVVKISAQLKSEQRGNTVDAVVANYIAALFVSRILEGCFWIIALCVPCSLLQLFFVTL